jgi:hypothetical protein
MELSRSAPTFIAGHRGLVGSAIYRRLQALGFDNLVTRDHAELDLTDAPATAAFFEQVRPTYVFVAAAKVGGILANATYPADFIRINLQIQTNVLCAAHAARVDTRGSPRITVQGSGLRTETTSSRVLASSRRSPRPKCWMCPGVFPRSRRYFPRTMFIARQR